MGNIDEALSLMLVGMITVFIILTLVVVIGSLVIRLTNRFIPVAEKSDESAAPSRKRKIHTQKLAAIVAAVDVITNGKGRVVDIDKK